ncbi:MAG: hypothetical protein AAGH67_09850 [Cyanobacteria bacterium P01_H01_bin.162]
MTSMCQVSAIGVGVCLGLSLWAGDAIALPDPERMEPRQMTQLQLTEQPETAIDWLLDAVEEQPKTAESFILAHPNLTAEQQLQIQEIYARYDLDLQIAVEAYLQSVNLLTNLVSPETANEAIAYVRGEVLANEQVVHDLLFQRTMAIRAILPVEQRTPLNQLLRSLLNLGTPIEASTFPFDLIGQPAAAATDQLLEQGWNLSVQTPRTLFFDREGQMLDLIINGDRQVAEVQLTP